MCTLGLLLEVWLKIWGFITRETKGARNRRASKDEAEATDATFDSKVPWLTRVYWNIGHTAIAKPGKSVSPPPHNKLSRKQSGEERFLINNLARQWGLRNLHFSPQNPQKYIFQSLKLFENYSKCRIWIFELWHFPPIFVVQLKLTCLVTLFDRKLQIFKNSPNTQNVNVARFARNVEWYFFCDFQTPCI